MAPHLFDIDNVEHAAPGILDNDGVFHSQGILGFDGAASGFGILNAVGVAYPDGVLESDCTYYSLESELSSPYLAGAAAQKVTDATFLETNKDEIIEDDADISAEFGVSGEAVIEGIDPADIVSLDYIKDGVERYVGSETYGSYPTTEASFSAGAAAQLVTDKSEVTTHAGSIKNNDTILTIGGEYDFTAAIMEGFDAGAAARLETDQGIVATHVDSIKNNDSILGVPGEYDFTAAIAAGFSAGQADRLETDVSLVAAKADFIVAGTDFTGGLGEVGNLAVVDVSDAGTGAAAGGTLDLDDYVLITALPDAKYLYNAIDRGDGTTGTLRASTLHSGAGAPGVDLAANILKDGETVDDIKGEYAGSGGGGGAALSRVRLGM
jgi:hypothetical protein